MGHSEERDDCGCVVSMSWGECSNLDCGYCGQLVCPHHHECVPTEDDDMKLSEAVQMVGEEVDIASHNMREDMPDIGAKLQKAWRVIQDNLPKDEERRSDV